MQRALIVATIAIVFIGAKPSPSQPVISLDGSYSALDALRAILNVSGRDFIIGPGFADRTVAVHFRQTPWDLALNDVLSATRGNVDDRTSKHDGPGLLVLRTDTRKRERPPAQRFIDFVRIGNTPPSEAREICQRILGSSGDVAVDPLLKVLVVKAPDWDAEECAQLMGVLVAGPDGGVPSIVHRDSCEPNSVDDTWETCAERVIDAGPPPDAGFIDDLKVDNAPLTFVLSEIEKSRPEPFAGSARLDPIAVRLKHTPYRVVMDSLADVYGVAWGTSWNSDQVVFGKKTWDEIDKEGYVDHEWDFERKTRIFKLKNRPAAEIVPVLRLLLSPIAWVEADSANQCVIVHGEPHTLRRIERMWNILDRTSLPTDWKWEPYDALGKEREKPPPKTHCGQDDNR